MNYLACMDGIDIASCLFKVKVCADVCMYVQLKQLLVIGQAMDKMAGEMESHPEHQYQGWSGSCISHE